MDQEDDRFDFPDRDGGDAVKPLGTTLRAEAADQPVQGNAGNQRAAPLPALLLGLLSCWVLLAFLAGQFLDFFLDPFFFFRSDDPSGLPAPVQVRARLVSAVHALLREAPAAFAVAAAYRSVAEDGDLGLAAWARLGCLYPTLVLARAAAVRAAITLAGAIRLRTDVAPPPDADLAPEPAPLPAVAPVPVRAYLLAAIRAGVREVLRGAPAALGFAVAYRDVAGDGDLGLAAWARSGILVPALHVASAAAVIAGHLLAAAHGLRPSHAAVRAFLREAPAAFAVAAAYRSVAADGDLGLAAWGRCALVYSALHVAGTAAVRAAAVLAGHPLAAALGLRPRHAVRDIVIVVLAVAAVLAAIHFP
ncbi:hypothetical protein EJB05_00150, partial [Eragrostis curvula]